MKVIFGRPFLIAYKEVDGVQFVLKKKGKNQTLRAGRR